MEFWGQYQPKICDLCSHPLSPFFLFFFPFSFLTPASPGVWMQSRQCMCGFSVQSVYIRGRDRRSRAGCFRQENKEYLNPTFAQSHLIVQENTWKGPISINPSHSLWSKPGTEKHPWGSFEFHTYSPLLQLRNSTAVCLLQEDDSSHLLVLDTRQQLVVQWDPCFDSYENAF